MPCARNSSRSDDAEFSARIAALLRQLRPSDEDLAAILRDAQLVGQAFELREAAPLPRNRAATPLSFGRARQAKRRN